MLDLAYARDLVMTGVVFGAAAFVWAGWAHERPPKGALWRVILVLLQLAGLALMAWGIPTAVQHWSSPTALNPGSAAFIWYVVVFWLEVIAIVVLSIYFARSGRGALIAPLVLTIVGLHLVPLAFVFGQSILMIAAVLITAVGVAAAFLPQRVAAPSFWSGILAAPIFLILGTIALVAGATALSA